jgi:hypothetical protein
MGNLGFSTRVSRRFTYQILPYLIENRFRNFALGKALNHRSLDGLEIQ